MRTVVLLDTNALFLPVRVGFPLLEEIDRLFPGARVVIATSGIRELNRLVDRDAPGAPGARALAERFERTPIASEGDDAIVEAALRNRATVVTADRALQQRLERHGIQVLAPRDRHRLELRPARAGRLPRRRPGTVRAKKIAQQARSRGNG